MPIAFGLWSLALGADRNWDLYNYHLYNPFALLAGKHGIDFAPGGLQSFFNPLLDVPAYLAITHLPSRLAGFLMGLLHGANFVLLLAIARRALPADAPPGAPFWLALAGMLTGNFLSELGNSMGDNATALGVLGALLLVVQSWRAGRAPPFAAAGVLVGLATGLKLTNAPYAIALCAALLVLPLPLPRRAGLALAFAAGALAGFAVTGGWWLLRMWDAFGNPLFPQFGNVFPNPLAASISIADRAWVPKAWWQHLAWPFVISFDARRAGQLAFRQVIWALVYAAFLAWALAAAWRRGRPAGRAPLDGGARVVLFVVATGFVAWMELFGIYRYLVPIELLAPLAIFLVASARWPMGKAVRASRGVLVVATLVALAGMKTWGHAGWRDPLLHFDVPPLAEPARTTVLIAGGDPPWSWLAVGFPRDVAFFQLGGNFPEGPRFRPMIGERIARRGGPVFAVVTGHHDARVDEGKPARRDIPAENRAERERAARLLAAYGFTLRPEACSEHRAGIGAEVQVFQWCPLS